MNVNGLLMQNITLPKSQPVRLEELLSESDEDDNDESEEKPCQSENESDYDEPILHDFSNDDISQKMFVPKSDANSVPVELTDGILETTCILPTGAQEAMNNTSLQKNTNFKTDKEQCKVSDVSSSSKLELCSFKNEEKIQENHSETFVSRNQVDTVNNHSTNLALPPPLLSVYKGDYNAKLDTNKTLSTNPDKMHRENAYLPDILNKRKEGSMYSTLMENKISLTKNNELNASIDNQQSKCDLIEQASKDNQEEFHKISNVVSESTSSCTTQTSENLIHPIKYSLKKNTAKYEANEKFTPAKSTMHTPLNEKDKSLTAINRLISETPLKNVRVSVHPSPCMSHKQLFQTPQNKLSDDPNKNHIQTPSMILPSWYHNMMRQTPMESKISIAKDHVQKSKNSICTPIMEKPDTSSYPEKEAKNIRRPLEPKPFLHTHAETKNVIPEFQSEENKSRNTDFKSVKSIEELKNNKSFDILGDKDRKVMQDKNEGKQMIIDTNVKLIQDNLKRSMECNIIPDIDLKNPHYLVHDKQCKDNMANLQFSIPSSIPQRQSKTLIVKDKEYLILGFLGRGMSGEVLRVQDLSCGELRAIKCVNLSKMDKDSAQGCLDEISMLHKLQAPCVVKMFDYQIKNFMVYVIMEMGDTDLSKLLKSMSQEKQTSLTMILYYWTEMLTAVKHIHDNGVIHSDLKPGNFLLVRGRLKLIDFGIASSLNSDMTSVVKNNPIGTLNYISPEALMDIGGNADSPTHNVKYKISYKSDVWSLGCILYSLVYGYTPFHHIRSQWAKVNAITNPKLNISFPTVSEDCQGCERTPPILIDVMRKCLQHDPKARPTVSQLLQVQYVPTTPNTSVPSDIPTSILVKIKHALNEDEWRLLIQNLDTKRHYV